MSLHGVHLHNLLDDNIGIHVSRLRTLSLPGKSAALLFGRP